MTATPGYVTCSTPQSLYSVGDLVTVAGTFTDTSGNPATPTTVTLKWSPSGTTTVTTLVAITGSGGVYISTVDTSSMGPGPTQVIFEFEGTGDCQAVGQGYFWVNPLPF